MASESYTAGGGYSDTIGGVLTLSETVANDGSYNYHYYTAVTFDGVAYASYADQYTAANFRSGRTFYNASGAVMASESYTPGGGYSDTVGGQLTVAETVAGDGSYNYHYYIPVTFDGVTYASYADQYTAANFRSGRTFYNASGAVMASESYTAGGGYSDTIGGVLTISETVANDGSYNYHYYTAVTFDGVAYASYADQYTAANFRSGRTFYDASGHVQASENYTANGGYSDTVGGVLVFTDAINTDGSSLQTYSNITGASYTNEVQAFDGSGNRLAQTLTLTNSSLSAILTSTGEHLSLISGQEVLSFGSDQFALGIAGTGTIDLTGATNATVAIGAGIGMQTLLGFQLSGAGEDHLTIDHTVIPDWTHLMNDATQVNGNVLVTIDANDTITFQNMTLSAFHTMDVSFI
jgi:hypothetical protein